MDCLEVIENCLVCETSQVCILCDIGNVNVELYDAYKNQNFVCIQSEVFCGLKG